MISLLVRLGFVFLVLNIVLKPTDAGARYGNRVRSDYESDVAMLNGRNRPETIIGSNFIFPPQSTTGRGLGISAWGIIALVVSLILAGLGIYYFSICYTICKTDKSKYDKMGMPIAA